MNKKNARDTENTRDPGNARKIQVTQEIQEKYI